MLWQRGRISVLIVLAALSACGSADHDVFGRSYDECILRNARTGGDEQSRQTATDICARRFERAPTRADLENLQPGSTVRFDRTVSDLDFGSDGFTPTFVNRTIDDLIVTVRNESSNLIVLEVETSVVFMSKPRLPSGDWPADAEIVAVLTWNLEPYAGPGETGSAVGTFDEQRAPSRYYTRKTEIIRVLPLQ
jgi:hypothetical protein